MPDDLDAHAVGRLDARRLAVEVARRGDQPGRDHAVVHRALLAVDVGEERLERAHPLLDARLDGRATPPASMTRGTASSGKGRSSPGEVERDALSEVRAARARRCGRAARPASSGRARRGSRGTTRGRCPAASNISSHAGARRGVCWASWRWRRSRRTGQPCAEPRPAVLPWCFDARCPLPLPNAPVTK